MSNDQAGATPEQKLAHAKAVADDIRPHAPDQAAAIDAAIAEVEAGKRDSVSVNVAISFKLEKFHGPLVPGAEPYEVLEGTG